MGGLGSLAACDLLYDAGYNNLFWVQGGLEVAEEEDLAREESQPPKFAGIGGVSEFLGLFLTHSPVSCDLIEDFE
ncbi:hypothetical protein COLO4_37484 [Corchorus olitorius]|uniref:Rhodanese domain-containing protein n=1 Tax=Corchorus olitorius TaxID=93759 RepID=A0A1R3G1A6_9ROSI|nr:hypothetical protein COLO4_37484 [Corchorus olitorius]